MKDAVVILVNGEVFAGGPNSTISDQLRNAKELAEGLFPILSSELNVAILHGNKPQVGYVLFRSELASHVLHSIPLDVCGADTQGATGYMLSQSLMNVLNKRNEGRQVICVLTQTVVDSNDALFHQSTKSIGPRFDRDKAEQHRQTRGWHIVEEPGFGYRRAVPAPPPLEIVEIDNMFATLKDVDNESISFTLVNPYVLREYSFDVPIAIQTLLEINENSKIKVYNIVVIQQPLEKSQVNFLAPIIVNEDNKKLAQLVLDQTEYPDFGVAQSISEFIEE